MSSPTLPSPYDVPELYDLMLDSFRDDLPFWLATVREGAGPALEVGCGTGRVLLHLVEQGCDVDGVDLSTAMLDRLTAKARARGLAPPKLYVADMRDFTTARRYARVLIPFNAFAHLETIDDQLRCLRCCREHLRPGGMLAIHMSYPRAAYWLEADAEPVMEIEVRHPESGHPVRMYDTRRKDRAAQTQHSTIEIVELNGAGAVVRSHRFETTQRWVYRHELELLLRAVGFTRIEILGGWDRRPFTTEDEPMLALASKD